MLLTQAHPNLRIMVRTTGILRLNLMLTEVAVPQEVKEREDFQMSEKFMVG